MAKLNTKDANSGKAPTQKKKATKTVKKQKPAGPGRGRKKGDLARGEAHKGARERKIARAKRAFEMRCNGATIRTIAAELKCSPSTAHEAIDEYAEQLKVKTLDLAEQERGIALQQIDEAISRVMPHIRGEVQIETVKDGARGPILITVEEFDARMKGTNALVKLLDRKSKLLGMDAPVKVEETKKPETILPPEEQLARSRDLLARWGATPGASMYAPRAIAGEAVE